MEIPGFELLERLGEGGMSTVWKARQLSLDRVVAIKILAARLAGDKDDARRFQMEAQAMAGLKHPGIVQVYDANVHQGVYYFVMEYIAGYSVAEWIRRKSVIPEGDALLTAEYIADALGYAWSTQSIIHCDIKPDNVMIDADGTVKVADLGLARSIATAGVAAESDDVMGTPNFMSPEQVMGDQNLDCRADIYSLGAMLYHMTTGKMLFHDTVDAKAMDRQVTDYAPDALDLNPKLSMGTCWLIEKMLAKDRKVRHADWNAVLLDIAKVRKGKMPAVEELPSSASTMKRSSKRTRARGARLKKTGKEISSARVIKTQEASIVPAAVITVAVLGVAAGIYWWETRPEPIPEELIRQFEPAGLSKVNGQQDAMLARAAEAFRVADEWADRNKEKYDDAIGRLEDVARATRGTKYSSMAIARSVKIKEAKKKAVESVQVELALKVRDLLQQRRFDEAESVCRDYDGVFVNETAEERLRLVNRVIKKISELKAEDDKAARESDRKRTGALMNEVATSLIGSGARVALELLNQTAKHQEVSESEEVVSTRQLIEKIDGLNKIVMQSFQAQQGQTVTISTKDGVRSFRITGVYGDALHGQESINGNVSAMRPVEVEVGQLSASEVVGRLGPTDSEEILIKKGLLAAQARAYGQAMEYFEKSGTGLARALAIKIAEISKAEGKAVAESALVNLMKGLGVNVPEVFDVATWKAAIAAARMTGVSGQVIEARVEAFRLKYGQAALREGVEDVLSALLDKAGNNPDAEAIEAPAAPVPAINLAAFRRNLMMVNRGLTPESIEVRKSESYPGYRLTVKSESLQNVGSLRISGSGISELDISGSGVRDLSGISGMTIRSLDISDTQIVSMPSMHNIPLERLIMNRTQMRDFGFLVHLKLLRELSMAGVKIADLSAIQNLKLEALNLSDIPLRKGSLAVLQNMPLKRLILDRTGIDNLHFCKMLDLDELSVADAPVSALFAVKGMKLKALNISRTRISDLLPLSGMPLRSLDLSGSMVGNLSPLSGMKLSSLNISGSQVRDLAPLAGMPIQNLSCLGVTPVSWEPLYDMPIVNLVISNPLMSEPIRQLLKNLPELKTVNGQPQ